MNLSTLLEMVAEGSDGRVVMGSRNAGWTGAELLDTSRRAASRFRTTGAQHVALVDLNSEAVPVTLFGSALAGLPFVPVNYRLAGEQLDAILARVAPAVVVVGADSEARLRTSIGDHPGTSLLRASELIAPGIGEADYPEWTDPDEVAVLLFTSGTTGEPKAAVLRHRHLFSYVTTTVDFMAAGRDEAQLISVPPYHIAGVSSVLSSLYAGRRIVYLDAFDPDRWVGLAEAEAVTQAMVVPTMLGRILDVVERTGTALPALRHVSYGGGRMPVETVERAMQIWPQVDFVNAYGLTETSSTVAVLTPDDHRRAAASADEAVRRRLTSVGRPLPEVEISVRDPDGTAVPAGERGEVWVRGPQVAGEYLGRSLIDGEGWFATRDAGWVDSGGYLFLDGRLDDVIVRGGENLSPGEIEEVLLAHPAVAEVAVVGVPDPEWGEAVAAAVVLRPGRSAEVAELQEWVRSRLRSTRVPEVIRFRSELPYSDTGKLLRRAVRGDLGGP